MLKKVVISAREDHEIIKRVIGKLSKLKEIELITHDPKKDYFTLSSMPTSFKEADLIIVKVRNECSIDLLHFAKIYNIPTLHDVDTVLMCKNKVSLDFSLREAFVKHPTLNRYFSLPHSWNQNVSDILQFKDWAASKLPFVIKSHYQHDKNNRFNFLVRELNEIDIFCKKYAEFLYYDVYIQEFIESDGIERKIYVVGDKIYGIQRENPLYIYLREKPENINVEKIPRQEFKITESIRTLARILAKELDVKIFGFDLIRPLSKRKYYLIDLNDFPGFMGIPNIEDAIVEYIKNYISNI
ncbi:MAG: RimK family alpha-L-glutamate ligase [Candidatus Heimdallarchaeota archaeon]